jgi:uncharacterized protein (DUF2336 family)
MDDAAPIDVEELIRLAHDRSAASRKQLIETIGDLFFEKGDVLSDRERTIMADILRQLIHDVELTVRKHLAIRLSDEPEAPHELVIALANDDAEVAHSILMSSEVLRDPDLIEIIRHRTLEHQLAVSMRRSISEDVCDALVATDDVNVITRMLENPNANIAQATMEYLVEQSRRIDEFQNPLVHRADLPRDLAERMYWWVSAALRVHIVRNFDVDPTELDSTMEEIVSAVGAELTEERQTATERLADNLVKANGPDHDLLVRLLRQGEISLFEAVLGQMTDLRDNLVRRLIYEPGGEGLAIACRAIHVDKAIFGSIFVLSRKARPGSHEVADGETTRVLEFYEQIATEAAALILDRWRRNPDYLDLLRQVTYLTQPAG